MTTIDLIRPTQIAAEFTDASETTPIGEDLLVRVLDPYAYKGCRYLLDAELQSYP